MAKGLDQSEPINLYTLCDLSIESIVLTVNVSSRCQDVLVASNAQQLKSTLVGIIY